MTRTELLSFAGFDPDSAAEIIRVNRLMNQYAADAEHNRYRYRDD